MVGVTRSSLTGDSNRGMDGGQSAGYVNRGGHEGTKAQEHRGTRAQRREGAKARGHRGARAQRNKYAREGGIREKVLIGGCDPYPVHALHPCKLQGILAFSHKLHRLI